MRLAKSNSHTFHIPVMGIGFTLDTPLRVAPYGITSTISLVDDQLIEDFRCGLCAERGLPYERTEGGDLRARRIATYLTLVDQLAEQDFNQLRNSSFDDPRGISRYLKLLPTESPLRIQYLEYLSLPAGAERDALEATLRAALRPGSIDVNIMTKLDRRKDNRGNERPEGESDAVAALRGFAMSTLKGAVILSAGVNPRVNAALSGFDDFFPVNGEPPRKRVILKVGDFRSAQVQARMLCRKGIWPSEYRVESGLNCGGHAFPTQGYLLGPVLEDFRQRRATLREELFPAYVQGLANRGITPPSEAPPLRVTAQGGLGTTAEDRLLREHFEVDATGWGTPFLLVEETTRVSAVTRRALAEAKPGEVRWTWGSPLGVPFWSIKTSGSEVDHRRRIAEGVPGRPCTNGLLALQELDGLPSCPASRKHQERKLSELSSVPEPERSLLVARTLAPTCICRDLGGDVRILLGIDPEAAPSICPGPSLYTFDRELTLDELVDHIYGRANVAAARPRPHQLVTEAELYVTFLNDELQLLGTPLAAHPPKWLAEFRTNLIASIEFTRGLASRVEDALRKDFVEALDTLSAQLHSLKLPESTSS